MKHGLQRAVTGMTIGHIRSLEKRRAMLGYDALGEIQNRFQVPISGAAGAEIGWDEVEVTFDVKFVYAPEQYDSPLTMPHFTYGPVLDVAVAISAAVTDWTADTTGAITGATVKLGACQPGASGTTAFEGFVHLTFKGFGAPKEDSTDLDVGT